jgi:hypothetical protein
MNRDEIERRLRSIDTPVLLRLLGIVGAVILAAAVVLIGTQRQSRESTTTGEEARAEQQPSRQQPPIQPAVDTVLSASIPHHFSEDLVIPGFTATGADIVRQDDREGRSPEGV